MLRLYWARNDGMGGHVFLGASDLRALAVEMEAQGMTGWLGLDRLVPGSRIEPGAVDLAVSRAAAEPLTLADGKLWGDWLRFLRGAAENGGILVR